MSPVLSSAVVVRAFEGHGRAAGVVAGGEVVANRDQDPLNALLVVVQGGEQRVLDGPLGSGGVAQPPPTGVGQHDTVPVPVGGVTPALHEPRGLKCR